MTLRPFEPPPAAILFDLDDTLCDYAAAREARLRVAFSLGPDGCPVERPRTDIDDMIRASIAMHPHACDHFGELFTRYGIDDPAVVRAAADWYRGNRFHGLRLFPEAVNVLCRVKRFRLPDGRHSTRTLGVITNGPADVQRAKSGLLNIDDLVDFVIISGEFGVAKPDAEIFHEALRRAGVSAEEAVFVGDSPDLDMAGASAVGMRTVWVNRCGSPWNLPSPAPCREIQTLAQLPALVGEDGG